jgi:hypothetical protein
MKLASRPIFLEPPMKYLNLVVFALSAILLTGGNFAAAQTSAPGGAQMTPPAGSDSSGSPRHRGERDCSKAQDPAAYEARAKAREQRRQQMMQACAGADSRLPANSCRSPATRPFWQRNTSLRSLA